jgi:hypothetical protein
MIATSNAQTQGQAVLANAAEPNNPRHTVPARPLFGGNVKAAYSRSPVTAELCVIGSPLDQSPQSRRCGRKEAGEVGAVGLSRELAACGDRSTALAVFLLNGRIIGID